MAATVNSASGDILPPFCLEYEFHSGFLHIAPLMQQGKLWIFEIGDFIVLSLGISKWFYQSMSNIVSFVKHFLALSCPEFMNSQSPLPGLQKET